MTPKECATMLFGNKKGPVSWGDLVPVAENIDKLNRRVAELERKVADLAKNRDL